MRCEIGKSDYFCLASIAGCTAFLEALEEVIIEKEGQSLKIPKILTNFLAGSYPTELENELKLGQLDINEINLYSRRFAAQTITRIIGTSQVLKQNPESIIPKYMESLEFRKFRAKSYFNITDKCRVIAIGDVANGGDYGYSKAPKMENFVLIAKELIRNGFKVAFVDPTTNFSHQEILKNFDKKEQENIIFSYANFKPIFYDGKTYIQSSFLNNVDILSICTDYLGVDTGCSHLVGSVILQAGNNPSLVQLWSNSIYNKNRGVYDQSTKAYNSTEWGLYNATHFTGSPDGLDDYHSIDTINPNTVIEHFINTKYANSN